jgi:hypothetical protein
MTTPTVTEHGMRRAALATIVAMIVGCTNDGQSPGTETSEVESTGRAVTSSNGWEAQTAQSGIDGETRTAIREYDFSDRQTLFRVTASCVVDTGVSELTIDSYVGDPQNPQDASAFLAQGQDARFLVPVGRAKAGNDPAAELHAYFSLGKDYNNRLRLDFSNPIAQRILPEAPGYSVLATTFGEGDVNYARLLMATLPLTIQVKNGSGEFEIEVDKSKVIVDTLQACGAAGPLLSASYAARVQDTQESLRAEVLKNIKNICGYRGVVRETPEPWVGNAKLLSISLDCAESAPQEFAVFNKKIDGYVEKAGEKGIACSREALIRQAEQAGVDDSFLWNSHLANYCSS